LQQRILQYLFKFLHLKRLSLPRLSITNKSCYWRSSYQLDIAWIITKARSVTTNEIFTSRLKNSWVKFWIVTLGFKIKLFGCWWQKQDRNCNV